MGTGNACKNRSVPRDRSPAALPRPTKYRKGHDAEHEDDANSGQSERRSRSFIINAATLQSVATSDASFHLCSCHSFQARLCQIVSHCGVDGEF